VWYRRASASSGLTPTERSEANYKLAFNAFLSKDYEAATAILKEITANLESDSGQEFSNDALELLFLIEENKERSKEGLDIYANARFLLARNRQEDAIASLREITVNHDSSDVADKAYLQLAELMVERGEYAAAVAVLESFLEKHPDNLNTDYARKRLGDIYEDNLGDHGRAYAAYEQVLVNHPFSVYLEEVRKRMRTIQPFLINN
jgi:tetratricopeptide (TPR) repeat protein